jgi:hypothetical protein
LPWFFDFCRRALVPWRIGQAMPPTTPAAEFFTASFMAGPLFLPKLYAAYHPAVSKNQLQATAVSPVNVSTSITDLITKYQLYL